MFETCVDEQVYTVWDLVQGIILHLTDGMTSSEYLAKASSGIDVSFERAYLDRLKHLAMSIAERLRQKKKVLLG